MLPKPRSIFVLHAADGADLAFAAESLEAAEALCHTAWFVRAVDEFRAHNGEATTCCYQARPASDIEAALYRRVADEFFGLPDCVFIAPLASGQNTAECAF